VDGSIKIFDTTTWQQVTILKVTNTLSLPSPCFRTTASLQLHCIEFYSVFVESRQLAHSYSMSSAAISADGKLSLTGCLDTNAHVWDIHTVLKSVGHEDLLSIPDVSAL
jgi:WD40 repeat protein